MAVLRFGLLRTCASLISASPAVSFSLNVTIRGDPFLSDSHYKTSSHLLFCTVDIFFGSYPELYSQSKPSGCLLDNKRYHSKVGGKNRKNLSTDLSAFNLDDVRMTVNGICRKFFVPQSLRCVCVCVCVTGSSYIF